MIRNNFSNQPLTPEACVNAFLPRMWCTTCHLTTSKVQYTVTTSLYKHYRYHRLRNIFSATSQPFIRLLSNAGGLGFQSATRARQAVNGSVFIRTTPNLLSSYSCYDAASQIWFVKPELRRWSPWIQQFRLIFIIGQSTVTSSVATARAPSQIPHPYCWRKSKAATIKMAVQRTFVARAFKNVLHKNFLPQRTPQSSSLPMFLRASHSLCGKSFTKYALDRLR